MNVAAHHWVGPFELRSLLEHSIDETHPKPPESGSAYVVTVKTWHSEPDASCLPLYVGGTTGKGARFRTRIGDLIADLLGFYGSETGHHSGGQSLHKWCKQHSVDPLSLSIAWVKGAACHRCLEVNLVAGLSPSLNRKAPPGCRIHNDA